MPTTTQTRPTAVDPPIASIYVVESKESKACISRLEEEDQFSSPVSHSTQQHCSEEEDGDETGSLPETTLSMLSSTSLLDSPTDTFYDDIDATLCPSIVHSTGYNPFQGYDAGVLTPSPTDPGASSAASFDTVYRA